MQILINNDSLLIAFTKRLHRFVSSMDDISNKATAWDKTVEMLEESYPNIQVHKATRNTGILLEATRMAMEELLDKAGSKSIAWSDLQRNLYCIQEGFRDGRIDEVFSLLFDTAVSLEKNQEKNHDETVSN